MLKVGDSAPVFNLKNQDDEQVNLSDFIGKKIILFFYPKDDTPGCTLEAKGFSENKSFFDQKDIVVFGISKDNVRSHSKFCNKYDLNLNLLSDEDTSVNQNYGVWKEKSMYGKTYFGTQRSTFVIDENGKIEKIWEKVKVKEHLDEVKAFFN